MQLKTADDRAPDIEALEALRRQTDIDADELPRLIEEATGLTLDEPKPPALRKARSRQIGVEGDLNVQPPRELVDTVCDEVRVEGDHHKVTGDHAR